MAQLAVIALLSFGVSLALVPACRALALAFGRTAAPREDRWHSRPTALFGGAAIFATVILVHMAVAGPSTLPILITGVSLMFAVGLIDDFVSLKPYTKLVAELAIASLFVFFGYRLSWSSSLTLDTLLTMLWIVGLTNALNLLDNMDGLCAGIGLIAGVSLLATFVLTGTVTPEAMYLAALVGALAGFLVYNIHPASIFMGDSGSLFVGLNLAVLTLGVPDETHGRVERPLDRRRPDAHAPHPHSGHHPGDRDATGLWPKRGPGRPRSLVASARRDWPAPSVRPSPCCGHSPAWAACSRLPFLAVPKRLGQRGCGCLHPRHDHLHRVPGAGPRLRERRRRPPPERPNHALRC